jgi:integrase
MPIEQRGRKWFAYLSVPADVRAKLGKRVYRQTLRTDSRSVAEGRAAILVAEWKTEIEAARGNPNTDNAAWRPVLAPPRRRTKELHPDGSGRTKGEVMDLEQGREALRLATTPEERERVLERLYAQATNIEYRLGGAALAGDREATRTDAHLDEWLASLRVTPGVKDTRRTDVLRLAGKFPLLHQIERPALNRWATALLQEGLAIGTVTRTLGAHRLYWRFLQSIGAVADDRNVFDRMDIARQARREASRPARRAFAPEEVSRLYAAALAGRNQPLADLIALGMWSGCRIEELTSLRVANVKADRFTIIQAKTEAGEREVPVHSKLAPTMARLIEASKDGYVLPGGQADKYGRRSHRLGRQFKVLKVAEGFDASVTFHSIRKTVATSLSHAGVPDSTIQALIGHKPTTLLHRTYAAGASFEMKRAALELLAYP